MREFAKLGLTRSVGGVLALALSRELTPVVTAIIIAGRVGSAFAAELGTMQVGQVLMDRMATWRAARPYHVMLICYIHLMSAIPSIHDEVPFGMVVPQSIVVGFGADGLPPGPGY